MIIVESNVERMQPVSITTPWIIQFVFVLGDMLVMASNVSHYKQLFGEVRICIQAKSYRLS